MFLDVRGSAVEMELPAESPGVIGEGRLLQDLRDIPDEEVSNSKVAAAPACLCCEWMRFFLSLLWVMGDGYGGVGRTLASSFERRGY